MDEPRFIPYEQASKIVAEVVEMEHPEEDGKRIFRIVKAHPHGRRLPELPWS